MFFCFLCFCACRFSGLVLLKPCDIVWSGMVWYGVGWGGMVCDEMGLYGMVWYAVVWYGMVLW